MTTENKITFEEMPEIFIKEYNSFYNNQLHRGKKFFYNNQHYEITKVYEGLIYYGEGDQDFLNASDLFWAFKHNNLTFE
jgi:hypothetical protein